MTTRVCFLGLICLLSFSFDAIAQNENISEILQRQTDMENEIRELRGELEVLKHSLLSKGSNIAKDPILPSDPSLTSRTAPETLADGTHYLKSPSENKDQANTPEEQFKQAHELITTRNYDKAKIILNDLVSKHPHDKIAIDACYWLGEIAFINGNHESAAISFGDSYGVYEKLKAKDKTVKDSSKAANSLIQLSRSFNKLGKKQQAKATLEQVGKEFPKHPRKIISVMTERARKEIGSS